jgi:hypothetical protein
VLVFASAAESRAGIDIPTAEHDDTEGGTVNAGDADRVPAGDSDTDAGEGTDVAAGSTHGAYTGTHTHAHSAMGAQGGDDTHEHAHTHDGDAVHDHAHPSSAAPAAAATTNQEGHRDMELTPEQTASLRAALGLGDDDELTGELLVTASAALKEKATKVSAGGRHPLPAGVRIVEDETWNQLNERVTAAEKFKKRVERNERDTVILAAIKDGKFSKARQEHWAKLWDGDPDGTREVLAGLQKNLVPTRDIGSGATGSGDQDVDDEYSALFGNPAGK